MSPSPSSCSSSTRCGGRRRRTSLFFSFSSFSSSSSVLLPALVAVLFIVAAEHGPRPVTASAHMFGHLARMIVHEQIGKEEVIARAEAFLKAEGFTVPTVDSSDCVDVPNADFPLTTTPCGRDRCALWIATSADATYSSCLTSPTAGGGPVYCQGIRQHFRQCMGLTCFDSYKSCLTAALNAFNTAMFTTCANSPSATCIPNAIRAGAFAFRDCTAGPAVITNLMPLFTAPTSVPLTQVLSTFWQGVRNQVSTTTQYAVVNINNGPGLQASTDYLWALDQLLTTGSKITLFGYVATVNSLTGNLRTATEVKADIVRWKSIYGTRFKGIYLEDVRGYTDFRLTYYSDLYKYAKRLGFTTVMANVGSDVTGAHLKTPTADIFVIFSGDQTQFNAYNPPWERYLNYDPSRLAVFVSNVSDSAAVVQRAQSLRIGNVFATSQSGGAELTTLSTSYSTLLTEIVARNAPDICVP